MNQRSTSEFSDTQRPLLTLLDYCGIATEFKNYKGELQTISEQARRYILASMGYVADEHSAQQILTEIREQEWRKPLPPVSIVRRGQALTVSLNLPARLTDRTLEWELITEQGESVSDTFAIEAAKITDRHRVGGQDHVVFELKLGNVLPIGQHRLALLDSGREVDSAPVLVTPSACYEPPSLVSGGKLFGVTLQLYTVRSAQNWGIGDFGDLRRFNAEAAALGVDIVGLNPLHALFPANPAHFSPYAPSNRAFLNVLYIDATAVPGFRESPAVQRHVLSQDFGARLENLRATDLVDYPGVSACKMPVLELLFQWFQAAHLGRQTNLEKDYQEFVQEQGNYLKQHAVYEALHEYFFCKDMQLWGWPVWPADYRHPENPAVHAFAQQRADRVEFFQYLQWCAFTQLRAAQSAATSSGMEIGIYLDLAVGVDQAGSEAWLNQSVYCFPASAGAPPDALALNGQDWGFPPLDPKPLRESGYQLFRRNLDASMSCAGAVRFDHAVSLMRLWWIPRGHGAGEGAYVNYNLDEILAVLALESHANKCLVIGEDLGTVPDELTGAMQKNAVYSYRLLYFEKEKENGRELPNAPMLKPENYPRRAVASVTTHDLPTLASWWIGSDVDDRIRCGLFRDEQQIAWFRDARRHDKQLLLDAIANAGITLESQDASSIPELTDALNIAIHAYLAASNSAIVIVQVDDWLKLREPINIPGTIQENPNWQRKLSVNLDEMLAAPAVVKMCRELQRRRS